MASEHREGTSKAAGSPFDTNKQHRKSIVNDAFSCIIKIMSSLQQTGLFIHSYNSVSDAPEENPLPSGRLPDPVVSLHTCRIKLIAGYKNHIEFVKSSVIIILI